MCPLTHIYTAIEVANKKSPLLVIGSVLPDVVWMSKAGIPSDKMHDNPIGFYNFVKENHKDMLDLVLGMMLHSNARGADYYSHFYNGGYAYNNGKKLISDLQKLSESDNYELNLTKAHNFIEAALDLNLSSKNKEPLELYKKSLNEIDFSEISQIISDYLNMDKVLIEKDLRSFFGSFGPDTISSADAFCESFFPTLVELAFDKKVSKQEVLPILKKAEKITTGSYEVLFEAMISGMKKDFAQLI